MDSKISEIKIILDEYKEKGAIKKFYLEDVPMKEVRLHIKLPNDTIYNTKIHCTWLMNTNLSIKGIIKTILSNAGVN